MIVASFIVAALAATACAAAPDLGAAALSLTQSFVTACPSREAGSAGAARAAEWISSNLASRGLSPCIDAFEEKVSWSTNAVTFRNVEARVPARGVKWGTVVLISHYDTKSGIPGFVGANDGAASSALLIELAARYCQHPLPRYEVLFLWTDGEECRIQYGDRDGFHGSRHAARKYRRRGERILAAVCLDMIGDRELKIGIPPNGSTRLAALALDAAGRNHVAAEPLPYLVRDDHQAFLEEGFAAIDLIDFEYGPENATWWHTAEDTVDKLSAASLAATAEVVRELLRRDLR